MCDKMKEMQLKGGEHAEKLCLNKLQFLLKGDILSY